jgi:hypothetical protein
MLHIVLELQPLHRLDTKLYGFIMFPSSALYADYLNGGMQAVLYKRNHFQLLWWLGELISFELSSVPILFLHVLI